jgi:hypothetical protein
MEAQEALKTMGEQKMPDATPKKAAVSFYGTGDSDQVRFTA